MVAGSELSERQIRLALAYAEQYPDEVEEKLRENRRPLGELKQLYPFFISRKTNRGAESCAFCSTRRLA